MKAKHFQFWRKWLTVSNGMIVLFGFIIAVAGDSIFLSMHNHYTRQVFFDGADFPPETLALKNWLFGIIGATIMGFHILMIFISENAFRRKEPWAPNAIWTALLSWFIVDSVISFYYGAIHNIVLVNLVALIVIGLPLIMTRTQFKKADSTID